MTDFPSWHRSPSGELKHFTQSPVPEGWEPAGGHYDFQLGIWIDDDTKPDGDYVVTGEVHELDLSTEPVKPPKNKGGRPRKSHK